MEPILDDHQYKTNGPSPSVGWLVEQSGDTTSRVHLGTILSTTITTQKTKKEAMSLNVFTAPSADATVKGYRDVSYSQSSTGITPISFSVGVLDDFVDLNQSYLTIRPVARKGYGSIAHEAKPNGLLTRGA